ncbi:MAG TPA: CoA pyrophosphatase [Solirubrobacteraceae bacterium]|nr:CoA pyrophosphatase [Solirubrobacteraceae bacterium]
MSGFTWPPEGAPAAAGSRPRGETQAAVLVPLFLDERSEPHLVLTRRRADLRRHAGEIAFPGGRRDDEDESLRDTALREAEEEIGLPRDRASVIGELPATSTFATGYLIHPFVATIPAGTAWRLSPREVDAVLELPLREVRQGRTTAELERRGINFQTDAYVVDEHMIWGATARIIEHLLERLRDGGAPGAPLRLE